MRRIKFTAPVESLRGNLSGGQKLTYPSHDNSAWDAPSNKRSYATNYKTRYIGALRSSSGRTYFSVKERTAVNQTDDARMAQALFGASASIANTFMHNPTSLSQLQVAYEYAYNMGLTKEGETMRAWTMRIVRRYLENQSDIYFNKSNSVWIAENPFIGEHVQNAWSFQADKEMLAKFWGQLAVSGISFTINSSKGVAFTGEDFDSIVSSTHNVLNLSIDGDDHVVFRGAIVYYEDTPVNPETGPSNNAEYIAY